MGRNRPGRGTGPGENGNESLPWCFEIAYRKNLAQISKKTTQQRGEYEREEKKRKGRVGKGVENRSQ